ncbi:MAG: energy-coupling factor ABC transporter ATP-binding protein [bacterium]
MKTISFENVSFSYNRDTKSKDQCLRDISFSIKDQNVLGVFGPSGSGKTTLIFLFCGLLKPDHGRILIDGENPWEQKDAWEKLMSRMGAAFQFPEDMFFQESVSEEFIEILKKKGHSTEDAELMAIKAIEWTGLDPGSIWHRHTMRLSYGQLRLLSLALLWAQDWDFLILDEPTVGLDCLLKEKILKDLISRCHQPGKLGIITSHDTSTLLPLVDHAIILNKGEIALYDSREGILRKWESISSLNLSIPALAELSIKLKKAGLPLSQIWQNQNQALKDILDMMP